MGGNDRPPYLPYPTADSDPSRLLIAPESVHWPPRLQVAWVLPVTYTLFTRFLAPSRLPKTPAPSSTTLAAEAALRPLLPSLHSEAA